MELTDRPSIKRLVKRRSWMARVWETDNERANMKFVFKIENQQMMTKTNANLAANRSEN